jgi:hypothetical protein
MKTTAAEAKAINDYIAARNAEFEAKCKAEGATWWCTCALTADDLEAYGVHTLEEYKRWQAESDALNDAKEARKNAYYETARVLALSMPGYDWDAWKDEMKESDM